MYNPYGRIEFINKKLKKSYYLLALVCFSGRHWHEKIANMHVAMKERNADAMVVNGLDETACRLQKLHENAFSI